MHFKFNLYWRPKEANMSNSGVDVSLPLANYQLAQGPIKIHLLNMDLAQKLHQYYFLLEPFFGICKYVLNSYIFKGGVTLKWANLFSPVNNETEPDLIEMLASALDYKKLFGMCPFKVITDPKTGEKRAVIPQYGTGSFVYALNPYTLQTEVFFIVFDKTEPSFGASNLGKKMTEDRWIKGYDPAIHVFVWPGHEPGVLDNEFKSDIAKLHGEYLRMEEFAENGLDADFNSSHPTVFTQVQAEKRDWTSLTENEQFADPDDQTMGPDGVRTYKRNVDRAMYMEKIAEYLNKIAKDGNLGVRKRLDPQKRKVEMFRRKPVWENNMKPLPEGEQMASQVKPLSRSDFSQLHADYEEKVCLVMGVNRTSIIGGKTRLKSEAETGRQLLHASVFRAREDANIFYQFVYNTMYRRDDNMELARLFISLDEEEREIAKDPEAFREAYWEIERARMQLETVAKKKNRIVLIFKENPFMENVDAREVMTLGDRGAITEMEEINLLRSKIGLEALPPSHQLIKDRQKAREAMQREALAPLASQSHTLPEKRKNKESKPLTKKSKTEEK